MAIYYKFRSEKNYKSISIGGPFITVGLLKKKINDTKIFKTKNSKYVKDVLVVLDSQSNQEYADDQTLIPKCTSVVICRFPRFPFKPIVLFQETADEEEDSKMLIAEDKLLYGTDFDDFGEDVFGFHKAAPLILGNQANPLRKTQALDNTATLDRPQSSGGAVVSGLAGQSYGRDRYKWLKPPAGYVCHRCKIPGHFIQHCPTNGDPNFDNKRVIPPTRIPKTMPTATTDGLHAKMNGMVSTCNVSDLPELNCPLCKQLMKDAALTSKCCFSSFCDKCIRDQFISKRKCVCGATDRLADELLPNTTLRETINRRFESKYNSSGSRDQGKEVAPLVSSKDKKSCVSQQEPLEITEAPDVPDISANKKKRKKADSHTNEIQGTTQPNSATQSYMTPGGSFAYNPYWNGMHPGMTEYMHPYYMAAYCNGQFGVPGMQPSKTGPHRESRKDPESRKVVSSSADVTSSKDQESRRSSREVSSSADLTSKKLKRVSATPPRESSKRRSSSRGDEYDDRYHNHKRHRSER